MAKPIGWVVNEEFIEAQQTVKSDRYILDMKPVLLKVDSVPVR